jgi:hypothetical protein
MSQTDEKGTSGTVIFKALDDGLLKELSGVIRLASQSDSTDLNYSQAQNIAFEVEDWVRRFSHTQTEQALDRLLEEQKIYFRDNETGQDVLYAVPVEAIEAERERLGGQSGE